jgi:hypothetical protein
VLLVSRREIVAVYSYGWDVNQPICTSRAIPLTYIKCHPLHILLVTYADEPHIAPAMKALLRQKLLNEYLWLTLTGLGIACFST